MRKIISKEQAERSSRRKQLIAGGVLVIVMLLSTIGYAFEVNLGSNANSGQVNVTKYNGNALAYANGFWNLKIGNLVYTFATNPQEAYKLDANSIINPASSYSGKPVYIYSQNPEAEAEVLRNMYLLTTLVRNACPQNEANCDASLPIKTCDDNFVIIKESNQTGVTQDRGCVYIKGPGANITSITDGFLLRVIGA